MAVTFLSVPFRDKDAAKALGARWDPLQRMWFVPAGRELAPFAAWLPATVSDTLPAVALDQAGPETGNAVATATRGVPLSQVLQGVAQAVAAAYPAAVWLVAEVVDARLRGGHVYLELAERAAQGQVLAKANAVIWASTAARILPAFEQATGVSVGPGIKLLLRARPQFKPQYGFSLEVDAVDADFTLGDLEARKRDIRERLQREGLYDRQKAVPPPWDCNRVLVVAPEGAAGLGDFQAEAGRLQHAGVCHFHVEHSRFQGEGAATEVAQALARGMARAAAGPGWDVVVIIRGGGAVNDLAWLNDYALARAVCELPVPVWTGIGHERDHTVLDEVAQQRFDTPSKVVQGIEQLIVQRAREAQQHFEAVTRTAQRALEAARRTVQQHERSIQMLARQQVAHSRLQTETWVQTVRQGAREAVHTARWLTKQDWGRVAQATQAGARRAREAVQRLHDEVGLQSRQTLVLARHDTQALVREITGQGPAKTLQRGFAMVQSPAGQPVMRAQAVQPGQRVQLVFHDGGVSATVDGPLLTHTSRS